MNGGGAEQEEESHGWRRRRKAGLSLLVRSTRQVGVQNNYFSNECGFQRHNSEVRAFLLVLPDC